MVRVAAPALSLDASGTLANSMVFSKWKGRNYVRSHVNPAQPRTGNQVGVRAMFKFLTQDWASNSTANKSTWLALAAQNAVSTFNAYIQYNQQRWRNFLGPSLAHPAAAASTPASAATVTATAGVRSVTIAITHGTTAPTLAYEIHRYPVTGTTPSFSTCVAVVKIDGSGNGAYVDTPLKAGTYYYKVVGDNTDGVRGATSTEQSAQVS